MAVVYSQNGVIVKDKEKTGIVEILGDVYKTKQIGSYTLTLNCIWSSSESNLKTKAGSSTLFYRAVEVTALNTALSGSGWHIPDYQEMNNFCTYLNSNGLFLIDVLALPLYHYDNNGNVSTWVAMGGLAQNETTPIIRYLDGSNKINEMYTNTNPNQYWVIRMFKDS